MPTFRDSLSVPSSYGVSSETSAIRTQTPGNYPKRNKLHLEHGESLKTRMTLPICSHRPPTPHPHPPPSHRSIPTNKRPLSFLTTYKVIIRNKSEGNSARITHFRCSTQRAVTSDVIYERGELISCVIRNFAVNNEELFS